MDAEPATPFHKPVWISIDLVEIEDGFRNARTSVANEIADVAALAGDMKDRGQLHPVVVLLRGDGRYPLRAGFRRHAAAKRVLGWEKILAVILPESTPEADACWTNLAENCVRKEFGGHDTARAAIDMLKKFNVSGSEFARRLGLSVSHVNNLVRYYRYLPPEVLDDWKAGHPLLTYRKLEQLSNMSLDEAAEAWIEEKMTGTAPKRLPKLGRATERQLDRLLSAFSKRSDLNPCCRQTGQAVVEFALMRSEIQGITDTATVKRILRAAGTESGP